MNKPVVEPDPTGRMCDDIDLAPWLVIIAKVWSLPKWKGIDADGHPRIMVNVSHSPHLSAAYSTLYFKYLYRAVCGGQFYPTFWYL